MARGAGRDSRAPANRGGIGRVQPGRRGHDVHFHPSLKYRYSPEDAPAPLKELLEKVPRIVDLAFDRVPGLVVAHLRQTEHQARNYIFPAAWT